MTSHRSEEAFKQTSCDRRHNRLWWSVGLIATVTVTLVATVVYAITSSSEASSAAATVQVCVTGNEKSIDNLRKDMTGLRCEIRDEIKSIREKQDKLVESDNQILRILVRLDKRSNENDRR